MRELLTFLLYALTQARIAGELPEQRDCCIRWANWGCAKDGGCEWKAPNCECELSYTGICPRVWCGDKEGR